MELDIFSGRPNPRWALDGEAAEEMWSLVDGLTPGPVTPPELPGLGYRGFVCSSGSLTCRAFDARAAVGNLVLADPDRTVERWLLDRLPPEFESLRSVVAAAIQEEPS
ncbi:hypothetical protein AB0I68_21790 [Streptomyces sp. NPDC050448]|uniref:hypothetical protein n=1 Tax=Streptomyces sp. NPDC050448 TaxID=3155404 RepID=UPI00343F0DCE